MLLTGLLAGLALFGAYTLTRCWFRVEEGHLAVLTTFGAAEALAPGAHALRVWHPGLHFKRPWQKAITVPIMEQHLDLAGEEGGRVAMAEDGTLLRFDSILRYVPLEAELARFLFGLRNPREHMMGLFTCLLRNEIANFRAPRASQSPEGRFDFALQAGSYALIRRERALLNQHIERFCREQIAEDYGVRFHAVDLTDILAPDELTEALNAVINAHSDAEARYFRAEGDCQQRVLSSEKGVEIAAARALAAATEIDTIRSFLSQLQATGTLDLYVDRRRAEVHGESRAVFVKEGA
jgi:regulator of protease activity HflC (stomatin/prohibitin superfamily)